MSIFSPHAARAPFTEGRIAPPPRAAADIPGTAGNDDLDGTSSDDTFDLTQGGRDQANGLEGNDTFLLGATLDAADRINGSTGPLDTAILDGVYSNLVLANATLVSIERLILRGAAPGVERSYTITTHETTVAPGVTMTIVAEGNAELIFDGSAETNGRFAITAGARFNTITGGGGDDAITGGIYGDTLDGGGGDDMLSGGDGRDDLTGGTGADTFDGGGGDDTVRYTDATAGVTIDMLDPSNNGGEAADDTFISVERFSGSAFGDTYVANDQFNYFSGDDGDDYFVGYGDRDYFLGGFGFDTADYADAPNAVEFGRLQLFDPPRGELAFGFERVIGSAFGDTITTGGIRTGFLLNDLSDVEAGAGDDRLVLYGVVTGFDYDGGSGRDLLSVRRGVNFELTDANTHNFEVLVIYARSIVDFSAMATGFDAVRVVSAGAAGATIIANDRDNLISAGDGRDVIDASGGDDRINVKSAFARIDGGTGDDLLVIGGTTLIALTDANVTGVERVQLRGGASADLSAMAGGLQINLIGDAGETGSVIGTAGNDQIAGRDGDDTIAGGGGADRLRGGGGADTFVFASLADTADAGGAIDHIFDFSGAEGDKIDLSAIDADPDAAGQQRLALVDELHAGGSDYQVAIGPVTNGNLRLLFDVTHDGVADFAILVHTAGGGLTDGDLILGA